MCVGLYGLRNQQQLANVLSATVCCLAVVLSCRVLSSARGTCTGEKLHGPGGWVVRSVLREVHFSTCEPAQPWAGWSTVSAHWEPTKVSVLSPTLCLSLSCTNTTPQHVWWNLSYFWVCIELGLKCLLWQRIDSYISLLNVIQYIKIYCEGENVSFGCYVTFEVIIAIWCTVDGMFLQDADTSISKFIAPYPRKPQESQMCTIVML